MRNLFKTRRYLLGLTGAACVFSVLSYWALGRDRSAQSEYLTAKLERSSISNSVTATGTLQAVTTVQVGSQISGRLDSLYADYNSVVKKGQLLARIDPRTFQSEMAIQRAQVESAVAKLDASQADLSNQEANLLQAQASLESAQASNQSAQTSYARAQELLDKGLIAKSDYDTARSNADSAAAKVNEARAAVTQAQASIRSKQAQINQAKAEISGAKAGLEKASLSLELTNIYSPVDGVVISRNVDIGQTVAASLSAPTLFVIANDLAQMQVKASVDEADIGKISKGAAVEFTVDAYPKDTFHGSIDEIRLDPQTVQNVVTYNVIVGVANPDLKLKPGMTATITATVASRENILTAPNAALKFTPAGARAERDKTKKTLWILNDQGKPEPKSVEVGISNGVRTEIDSPDLSEGTVVIIGSSQTNSQTSPASSAAAKPRTTTTPFAIGGGRRGGF